MKVSAAVLALALALAASKSHGLEIIFDYRFDDQGFVGDTAKQTLESAAQTYEQLISDHLLGITPGFGNTWSAVFHNERNQLESVKDLVVPDGAVVVFVGSGDLPADQVLLGSGGGFDSFGLPAWNQRVSQRGQGITYGADAVDTGVWGGALWFDVANQQGLPRVWNFEEDVSQLAEQDFFTEAQIGIGLVLGFTTANAYENLVDVGTDTFLGSEASALHGGPVPLAPEFHFFSKGLESTSITTGLPQDVLFQQFKAPGERRSLTLLDVAALRDIGWEIDELHPPVAGDANGDGAVDLADFGVLKANFGEGTTRAQGDFDGNQVIDLVDFGILKANFGTSGTVMAPEPSGLALGGLALLTLPVFLHRAGRFRRL